MARLTRREEIDNCPGIWVQEGFANEGLQTWFSGYDEGYSVINKCAEYEDAEEQGLLLRLPCKVGDTVYLILKRLSEKTGRVEKLIIDAQIYEIEIFDKEILFKNNKTYSFQPKDVGKKVFLTEEEAKQALEGMKGG